MSYRRLRHVSTLINLGKNIVLCQKFCLKFLSLLGANYNVVNWDESLFVHHEFKDKAWFLKSKPTTTASKKPFTPTCLIAAITTSGKLYA